MSIENEVFKKHKLILDNLIPYGFIKENNVYIYSKNFMNNTFKAHITINENAIVNGKVFEIELNEEYTNFRIEGNTGEFVGKVREEYKNILQDIAEHCFKKVYFEFEQTNRICDYIIDRYNSRPEYLWKTTPNFGVFRNNDTGKWIALVQNFDKKYIVPTETGRIEVINLKLDEEVPKYIDNKTIFGYPQKARRNWLRVILDDSLNDDRIIELVDKSYEISNK